MKLSFSSISQKASDAFTLEKSLIYVLIFAILFSAGIVFYLIFSYFTKSVKLTSPVGGEEWQIGQTYSITWRSKQIDRVGIVLFKGAEPQWIAQNVLAGLGRFDWKIYPGQAYGSDYRIAIFEYPWKKGNKISYSGKQFAVTFPSTSTCDTLAIDKQWPYVASSFPNLRKVFLTKNNYTGNLGGLEGADKICQQEADSRNLGGQWMAFLGGEKDEEIAVSRLIQTDKLTNGVFVNADPESTLINGDTCHRLLGKNFDEFLGLLSDASIINNLKLTEGFTKDLANVWLGRLDNTSKKNCTTIADFLNRQDKPLQEKYSYTTTCQNWTKESQFVEGYPVAGKKPTFPTCYTETGGKLTDAVSMGGIGTNSFATGTFKQQAITALTAYAGSSCSDRQKLICVEK